MVADAEEHHDFGAIDVGALMEQVRLQQPAGTVTVRGSVEALRPWPADQPAFMYGDLRDIADRSTLSFKCPIAAAPLLPKEHVVLRGTLVVKRSTQHRGYDLELLGRRLGEWTPAQPASILPAGARTTVKRSLQRFIGDEPKAGLILIGTETAIRDAEKTLSSGVKQMPDSMVCSTALTSLQAVIAENAPKYDGLCLLRGGGDPDSFATWNDPRLVTALLHCGKPFYAALGHSSDLTLVDKYADESFATPSDFGASYAEAWKERERRKWENRRYDRLRREHEQLRAATESRVAAARSTELETHGNALRAAVADLQQMRSTAYPAWTWLVTLFLLGVLSGMVGYHLLTLSRIDGMENQLKLLRQQTVAPGVAPLPSGGRRRQR